MSDDQDRDDRRSKKHLIAAIIIGVCVFVVLPIASAVIYVAVNYDDLIEAAAKRSSATTPTTSPKAPSNPADTVDYQDWVTTDLTPYGLDATIDLPKGSTVIRGKNDYLIKNGFGDQFRVYLFYQNTNIAASKNSLKGTCIEEYSSDDSYRLRTRASFNVITVMRKDIVYGNFTISAGVNVSNATGGNNVEATWRSIRSFRQSDEQIARVKKCAEMFAEWKTRNWKVFLSAMNELVITIPIEELNPGLEEDLSLFPNITHLNFEGKTLTERGILKRLMGFRHFTSIGLWGPWVDDRVLRDLAECRCPIYLTIADDSATPEGIKEIGKLTNLEWLHYICEKSSKNRSTNDITEVALELPKLERLILTGRIIDSDQLTTIGSMSKLDALALDSCKLAGASLERIGKMEKLRVIWASSSDISADQLEELSESTTIEELDLNQTDLGDEVMPHIMKMKKLKTLRIEKTKITPSAIAELKKANKNVVVYN